MGDVNEDGITCYSGLHLGGVLTARLEGVVLSTRSGGIKVETRGLYKNQSL